MKENDNDENTNQEPQNTDNDMSNKNYKKLQSKLYVENTDEPALLRFSSVDRDDESERRNSAFLYNSEDDIYRINSSKIDKLDDKSQRRGSKNLLMSQISKTNLEVVKEAPSENEIASRPNNKIKNKNKKKDDENIRKNANFANEKLKNKKLTILFIITLCYLIFSIIELISGYYSNSIILMSDAAYYFCEFTFFIIYIISIHISKKNKINEIFFSFNRGEILGILISSTFLCGFSFWLIYYAIMRILQPKNINGFIIIILGIASTFFNVIMGLVLILYEFRNQINLNENNKKNNNLHSDDFQQLIDNSVQSFLIIIIGIIIYFNQNFFYLDPIYSFIFILLLLVNAYNYFKNSIKILMESSSLEFNIDELKNDLLGVNGIIEVYDIYIWNLSIGKISLCCHLKTFDSQNPLDEAKELIKNKYNITHTIIQIESETEKLDE